MSTDIPADDRDDLLPNSKVAQRYKVDARTLFRWDRRPELGFPPAIKILTRKYRSRRALEAWERQRAAATSGIVPRSGTSASQPEQSAA